MEKIYQLTTLNSDDKVNVEVKSHALSLLTYYEGCIC